MRAKNRAPPFSLSLLPLTLCFTHLAELLLPGGLRRIARELLHDLEALVDVDQPQALCGQGTQQDRAKTAEEGAVKS